jgi:hypothetical protein
MLLKVDGLCVVNCFQIFFCFQIARRNHLKFNVNDLFQHSQRHEQISSNIFCVRSSLPENTRKTSTFREKAFHCLCPLTSRRKAFAGNIKVGYFSGLKFNIHFQKEYEDCSTTGLCCTITKYFTTFV